MTFRPTATSAHPGEPSFRHVDVRRRPRVRLDAAMGLLVALLVAVGCGSTTTSSPSGPTASARASDSTASGRAGSGGPTPQPTRWPITVIHAMTALGAGDNEIAKAVADISEAVAAEDLARMRSAAVGLHDLVTALGTNVDQIAAYPPMAGLATDYRAAFGPIVDGSTRLRAAIDAGNATDIVAATQQITSGMQAYGKVRGALSDWVDQLPDQQRLLVK